MTKVVKRLKNNNSVSVTAKRAANGEDGGIVPGKISAHNQNTRPVALGSADSLPTRKCRIPLRRLRLSPRGSVVIPTDVPKASSNLGFVQISPENETESKKLRPRGNAILSLRRKRFAADGNRQPIDDASMLSPEGTPRGALPRGSSTNEPVVDLDTPRNPSTIGTKESPKSNLSILAPFLPRQEDSSSVGKCNDRSRLSLRRGAKSSGTGTGSSQESSNGYSVELVSEETSLKEDGRNGRENRSVKPKQTGSSYKPCVVNVARIKSNKDAGKEQEKVHHELQTNANQLVSAETSDVNPGNKSKGDRANSRLPTIKKCGIKITRVKEKPISAVNKPATRNRRPQKVKQTPSTSAEKSPKRAVTNQIPRATCKSPDMFGDDAADSAQDIYAFNSQSSYSEREDFAADIIEKLKKEKKVFVSRRQNKLKSPGKRRKKGVQPANWRTVCRNLSVAVPVAKDRNKLAAAKRANTEKTAAPITVVQSDDDYDHFDNAIPEPHDEPSSVSADPPPMQTKSTSAGTGAMSMLAQKVLTKQAALKIAPASTSTPQRRRTLDKVKLLQMAKSLVNKSSVSHSTPNKPSTIQATSAGRSMNASGGASPWRVDNENVPRLFYFSRTSDDLPSYSSDVLPSSQGPSDISKRNRSIEKHVTNNNIAATKTLDSSTNTSKSSSFKSYVENILNISDIENISPVKRVEDKIKDNSALIGVNPRRGLADRSPLKAINILNVVTLPQRVTVVQPAEKRKPSKKNKENIGQRSSLSSNSDKSPLKPAGNESAKRSSMLNSSGTLDEKLLENVSYRDKTLDSNLSGSVSFGFSDEDENDPSLDVSEPIPPSKLPNKKRLRRRLTKLKRLLPPKPTRVDYGKIRSIFNSPKKQADIREMMSSTRNAGNKSFSGDMLDASEIASNASSDEAPTMNGDNTIADDAINLFEDPEEPQTTFDTSVQIRTYERPKRKAKRVHNFVLFSSDSEHEEEPVSKPKRTKSNKNNKELNKFITEFNSMCEEVDKYELVVEKDKSHNSTDCRCELCRGSKISNI